MLEVFPISSATARADGRLYRSEEWVVSDLCIVQDTSYCGAALTYLVKPLERWWRPASPLQYDTRRRCAAARGRDDSSVLHLHAEVMRLGLPKKQFGCATFLAERDAATPASHALQVISNAPNTTASRTWTQLPENLRKAVTSAGME
jgi:hypothetical protein